MKFVQGALGGDSLVLGFGLGEGLWYLDTNLAPGETRGPNNYPFFVFFVGGGVGRPDH